MGKLAPPPRSGCFKLSPKPRTDAVAQDVECQAAPLRWRKVREGVRVLSSNGVCYSRACPAWPAASAKNVFSLDCSIVDTTIGSKTARVDVVVLLLLLLLLPWATLWKW